MELNYGSDYSDEQQQLFTHALRIPRHGSFHLGALFQGALKFSKPVVFVTTLGTTNPTLGV